MNFQEQFIDPNFYEEQVGFLSVWKNIFPLLNEIPELQYDEEFGKDIIHLVSDMNSCSIHLFKFFRAKWVGAECRFTGKSRMTDSEWSEFFEHRFSRYLNLLVDADGKTVEVLKKPILDFEDTERIRKYFSFKGRLTLGIESISK